MFDTAIIGGGAAGLATAVMLKKRAPKLNIAIFEQLERVGKKISVTGNGRCNIANLNINENNFHGNSTDKAMSVLQSFSLSNIKDFFSSIGVEFAFEGDKAYPRSFQASSVVDAFRHAAEILGIHQFTSTKIININKKDNVFFLTPENQNFNISPLKARSVLIATGGLAGGSKLGCNGDGYKMLKNFGHRILPQSPVIVQVKTENTITKSLKGIKVNGLVTVTSQSKFLKSEFGEVLFCDYGLSGPPVFQLSRYCEAGAVIHIDMLNDISFKDLTSLLLKRREIFKGIELTEFFSGLLHKRLGQAVLKACGLKLTDHCNTLTDTDCKIISKTLKDFSFKVIGTTGFVNAQATAGGADLKEFDHGLMSKKTSGLFAAGEVLDVDGDCGGYNLLWAWCSANATASSITNYLLRSLK